MSQYIASYDISEDRNRRRVARILQGYGFRIQKSVFHVWVEAEELADFRIDIGMNLETTDQFALFPIDCRENRSQISWQRPIASLPAVIVF